MAITDEKGRWPRRGTRLGSFIAFLLCPLFGIVGCGEPQIGSDKETFKTVDALYTAVGLKDTKLVDQCREKLEGLRQGGKLPEDAARSLLSDHLRGQEWKLGGCPDAVEQFHGGAATVIWESGRDLTL